jgi:single-strand DNA-binding protein
MRNVNKVTLLGRLTTDPILSYSSIGNPYSRLRVATNYSKKNPQGGYTTDVEFHNVTCWGKVAESVSSALKKGAAVYIEGHLSTRTWEDEQGKKQYAKEINSTIVNFIDNKNNSAQQAIDNNELNLAENEEILQPKAKQKNKKVALAN